MQIIILWCMISEGLCDTEDWSNDDENLAFAEWSHEVACVW